MKVYVKSALNLSEEEWEQALKESDSKLDEYESDLSWKSTVEELQAEYEEGIDPLYEQTSAGTVIENIQYEVEEDLGVWLEPSIQGGQGGIWIYSSDSNEVLAEGIDYATFNENVIEVAITSDTEEQFKKWYKSFLERYIG